MLLPHPNAKRAREVREVPRRKRRCDQAPERNRERGVRVMGRPDAEGSCSDDNHHPGDRHDTEEQTVSNRQASVGPPSASSERGETNDRKTSEEGAYEPGLKHRRIDVQRDADQGTKKRRDKAEQR